MVGIGQVSGRRPRRRPVGAGWCRPARPGPSSTTRVIFLTYLPLAAAGLTRCSSSSTARKLRLQRVDREAGLADRHLHHAVAAGGGAVLDLAALEVADRLGHVGGDGAGLRVGHQATGAEHPTEAADERHQVGRGDGHVEVDVALLDLGGQVVGAHHVGAGLAGGGRGLAGGEHARPARPCPCPPAATRCRAAPGRPCGDRRRGPRPARRSRRTWRWPGPSPAPAPRSARRTGPGRNASRRRRTSCLSPSSAPSPGDRAPGRGGPRPRRGCGLAADAEAHAPGGAPDLGLGRLDVVGVEVGHLDLGDLFDLGLRDGADGGLARASWSPSPARPPGAAAPAWAAS